MDGVSFRICPPAVLLAKTGGVCRFGLLYLFRNDLDTIGIYGAMVFVYFLFYCLAPRALDYT